MVTPTRPVALVTGASSVIGKVATLALAAAGLPVVATSCTASRSPLADGVTS